MLLLMEDQTRPFDAALVLCTPAAGRAGHSTRRADYPLAHPVVFGWPGEWGAQELPVQGSVQAAGHCGFTADPVMAGRAAMERWLETGVRPDETAFVAGLGFDPQSAPGAWPY